MIGSPTKDLHLFCNAPMMGAHNLFLAIGAKARLSQNPDVEPKTIARLREIATATATAIKIHLAGVYKPPVTAKT